MTARLGCLVGLLILSLFSPIQGIGQAGPQSSHGADFLNLPTDSAAPADPPVNLPREDGDLFHSFEFILSLVVLIFGTLVVLLEAYLARAGVIKSEHIMKCLVITLVIIAALVLITAGYSNNQINGISGILGSIAGYLLGRSDSPPPATNKAHEKDQSQ